MGFGYYFHKYPSDPLRMVIVRDMWLTGFDTPCVHTLYVDKPMKGHNLMQAIARVNCVFKDKQGGLVVDYIGIGNELKSAMKEYTASKGRGRQTVDAHEVFSVLQGEIKSRFAGSVVQDRKFSEMLSNVIQRYQNRSIETAQVMEELIQMAKKFREASLQGEKLGLTEDEVRF